MDEFGNVSLFSPPARGVIFDTDAPPGPEPPEICINSLTTLMTDYEVKSFGETFEDIRRIRVQGRIIRASSLLGRMAVDRVVRYRQNGMDFDRDPVRIYSGAFGERDWIEIHDDFNLDEVDSGVYYRITPTLVTGRSGEVTTIPDTLQQESEMREIYIKGQGIDMTLEFDVEESRNCFEPDPSVTLEHIPRNGSGEIEPLVFLINQGDADQAEVILYRAEDCENYHIVSRESFDENGQASVEDDFAPDQGGRVCYAIRTVDENGNLSELEYIVASVVFTPLIDSNVIPPTLLGADRTGDEARPGVMLRWLSPDRNVTAFRVYFGNSQDASENDMSVYLDRDSYLLDEAIQTCTTALFSIDDRNGEPLAPDRPYWIHIEAIQQDGTGVMSLNGLRFVWNAVSVEGNYPGWPSRDPAPVIQGTQAEWLPNLLEIPTAFSQGIGVEIGRGKFDSRDRIILESSIIENPFIVYRKRLDKPERKFIQISGLVENIVISEDGTTINTPFVTIRIVPDQGKEQILDIKMYFLDTVNLIERAQYAYKIVELDKETGEIISERSQTNAVEVPR